MRRREIFLELTSLLDVIMIMLFVLLTQARTQTAEALSAAEADRAAATELRAELSGLREERDAARERLQAAGIPSMVYYPRGLHQQEAFRAMQLPDEWYPNTLEATKRVLSLPMHPYLAEEDAERVCGVIRERL